MSQLVRIAVLCLAGLWAGVNFPAQQLAEEQVESIRISRGGLSVLFRDNSQSPRLLSGIQSLFHLRHAPGFDAFDPDSQGASAGLNFEHVISGHPNRANKFTPRHGRYSLFRLSDGRSVALVRKPEDSPWKLASRLEYTVTEPHYIDLRFDCTAHDSSLFGDRGYALLFFANYMNDVAEIAMRFRGLTEPGGAETWIAANAPRTHPDWNGGGTYRHFEASDLGYDEDHNFKLNLWSYDYPRYTKPFFYGRAGKGMVYIVMFDRSYSNDDEIRFSLFKFKHLRKENPKPRPAWDFQYVIHKVEEGKNYGFRARVVWKKYVSPEDCLEEYERWAADRSA